MKISTIQILEARFRNIGGSAIIVNVVYNLIDSNGTVGGTKNIDLQMTGSTKSMMDVILHEIIKSIETNDGIKAHEGYEDIKNPKQKEQEHKKIVDEKRIKSEQAFKEKMEKRKNELKSEREKRDKVLDDQRNKFKPHKKP